MSRTSLFARLADLLVVVAVDERADALVGENLVEQAVEDPAVEDVDARRAGLDGLDGVRGLAAHGLGDALGLVLEDLAEGVDGDFAPDLAVDLEAAVRA